MDRRKFLLGVGAFGVAASTAPLISIMPVEAVATHPFLVWVYHNTSDRMIAIELIKWTGYKSAKGSVAAFLMDLVKEEKGSKFMVWLREVMDDPRYELCKRGETPEAKAYRDQLKDSVQESAEYAAKRFFPNWRDERAKLQLANSKDLGDKV